MDPGGTRMTDSPTTSRQRQQDTTRAAREEELDT